MGDILIFIENLNIVPKARPRCIPGRNQPILPPDYRKNQQEIVQRLLKVPKLKEDKSYRLKIHFCGHLKGDLDNKSGAILDALQKAKKIKDDNVKHIPALDISFSKSKKMLTILSFEEISYAEGYIPEWLDDLIDSNQITSAFVDIVFGRSN